MNFRTKKGTKFWPSLYWVQAKAREAVLEIMRGCTMALVESGKYAQFPHTLQVSRAVSRLHDTYHQGRLWGYDFDTILEVAPGKRYTVRPYTSKMTQLPISDILLSPDCPLREVTKPDVSWDGSVQCVVCTRDTAGAMFELVVQRVLQSDTIVYPPYYRMIKKQVQEAEEALE